MKIAKGYTKLQMWVYDTPVLQILVSHGYCVAIFTVVAGHYCSNIPFVRRNKRKGLQKDCGKESLRAKSSSVSHTGCCQRDCCFPVFTQTKLPLKSLRCSVGVRATSGCPSSSSTVSAWQTIHILYCEIVTLISEASVQCCWFGHFGFGKCICSWCVPFLGRALSSVMLAEVLIVK